MSHHTLAHGGYRLPALLRALWTESATMAAARGRFLRGATVRL